MSSDQLKKLYPFLHGNTKDELQEYTNLLESIKQKATSSIDTKQSFFESNAKLLIEFSQIIADAYLRKGRILTMGNGGSSCDASHLAVEFQHPVTTGREALPALNLTMDTAMLSAVSNDVGQRHVFVRQLEAHCQKNDVLIGFSTSGNSENLIVAYQKARDLGIPTLGFSGGNGGEMKSSGLLDICLVVESDSIHRIQETHLTSYHIIWDLVHTLLADQRGKLADGGQ